MQAVLHPKYCSIDVWKTTDIFYMSFLATGGKAEVKFYYVSKTGGCRRQLRVNQHDFLHSHSGRTETFLQRKQAGTAGNDAEGEQVSEHVR